MVRKWLLISMFVNAVGLSVTYYTWDRFMRLRSLSSLQDAQQNMVSAQNAAYLENKTAIYNSLTADSSEITFLGTSRTEGFPLAELYRSPKIRNRGIAGNCASDVLHRLNSVKNSKAIFLEIGINDIKNGIPLHKFITTCDTIFAFLSKTKANVIIESILPTTADYSLLNDKIRSANENIQLLCKIYNLKYIDLREFKMDNVNSYDGLHFTMNGYLQWKCCLDPYVLPLLNANEGS